MVVVLTNHIAATGGPKDGATCQGGHVLAGVGEDGHPVVPGSGTPMPKDGPRTAASDSRLGAGGAYYGGRAQTKKDEIGAVSFSFGASPRVAKLAGDAEVSRPQHLL